MRWGNGGRRERGKSPRAVQGDGLWQGEVSKGDSIVTFG